MFLSTEHRTILATLKPSKTGFRRIPIVSMDEISTYGFDDGLFSKGPAGAKGAFYFNFVIKDMKTTSGGLD